MVRSHDHQPPLIEDCLPTRHISAENLGVRECAEMLKGYYQGLGCVEAELDQWDPNPRA